MFYFILTVHIILCLFLVLLVLLQQGKGAQVGATFGGGANTVLGASGGKDMFTRVTTAAAIAFMITSIFLVRAYSDRQAFVTASSSDSLEGSIVQKIADSSAPVAVTAESAETVETADSQPAAAAQKAVEPQTNAGSVETKAVEAQPEEVKPADQPSDVKAGSAATNSAQ